MYDVDNEQLVMAIKQGATEYTAELWENTYKLIYKLITGYYNKFAERCQSCGVTLDDMKQESYIAFVGMIEAFDPEKGLKFSSYANFQIKNVVFGMLGFRTDKKRPLNDASSLNEPVPGYDVEDDKTIIDTIADGTATEAIESVEDDIFLSEFKSAIDKVMSEHLTELQRDVIYGRFYDNKTFNELADENGVNRDRIRRTEGLALNEIRKSQEMKRFRDEYITDHSFRFTSVGSFRERMGSSQELVIERLEEIAARK